MGLLFTRPDGELGTKAQDLAAYAAGVVRMREHERIATKPVARASGAMR
jgi:hypothetical protein